jgi:superfamily II DNA or RNA helicase
VNFSIRSPIKAFLLDYTEDELSSLRKALTYVNTSVKHLIKRHHNNHYWKNSNPESWQNNLDELQKNLKKTLVFEEDGQFYIRPGSIPYLSGFNIEVDNQIVYPKPKKMAWKNPPKFTLYPYQEESWTKLLQERHGNVSLCTGCHALGTEILLYDGSLKKVEDIIVGDQLMGPDSKPRNVLELHSGIDKMHNIIPVKGESFIVNSGHILSLQRTNTGNTFLRKDGTRASQENGPNPTINISVDEYLKLSKNRKHTLKLYRSSGINFEHKKEFKIPPYILGLWLGDGHSGGCGLTTMDKEIEECWCNYVLSLGLKLSVSSKINNKAKTFGGILETYRSAGRHKKDGTPKPRRPNEFNALLDEYGLINNKHIPQDYLTSSREDRLQLLAGLIDTDGYYFKGCFEIIQKNRILADNILFLARSLGFGVTKIDKKSRDQNGTEGLYVRMMITGDLCDVPTKLQRKRPEPRKQIKNVLRTGFSIEPAGIGNYYGFTVDGDNLYLMGDFTVTHNSGKSLVIIKLCRELGLNTCIVVPSKSIFHELLEKFEFYLGKSNVGALGDGKRKLGKKITIAIADSLVNLKPGTEEYEFFSNKEAFFADESHTLPSETLEEVCHGVLANAAFRFYFSGTQTRNDGSVPLLQSIIGKTVCSLTTSEAILGNYICPHDFRIVSVESSNPSFESTDALAIKREHFLKNRNIASFSAKLANGMASIGKGTLILVEELSQISMLIPLLKVPFAIAHSEKRKERLEELGIYKVDNAESVEKFNKGEVKILIGTSCIATGTNIFPCHNVISWVGGSSPIKTKQGSVGRGVRWGHHNPWAAKCLEKNSCTIFDFDIEDNFTLSRHLEARMECYRESGEGLIKYIRLKKS